jgi:hypothetical protein
MNKISKSLLLALAFGSSASTATASSVINDVTASGPGLGSFSVDEKGVASDGNFLDLSKTFSSVNPIILTFTVGHSEATGTPYNVNEAIENNTSTAFTGFHLHIDEPATPGNGVVFTSFSSSSSDDTAPDFTPNFTLDSPSKDQLSPFEHSGPRDLNFTGELKAGSTLDDGYFSLNMPDPGAGKTYTFTITQTPVAGVVPEPETYAMLLAGLGLLGFITRRKRTIP